MFNHRSIPARSRKKIDIKMLKEEIEKLEKLKAYINEKGYKGYYEDVKADSTTKRITMFLEDFIEELTKLLDNSRLLGASFPAKFNFSDKSKFNRLCNADCNTTIVDNEALKFFIGYAYKQLHNYIFLDETHVQSYTEYDESTSKSHKLSTAATSESESDTNSTSIKMGRYR